MAPFQNTTVAIWALFLSVCCISAPGAAQMLIPFDAGATAGLVGETVDPQQLVNDCLQNCFATNEHARVQVCGAVPNTSICLNRRDVPSCVLAHRALDGIVIQVPPSLCPTAPSTAPHAAPPAAPSPEEVARRRSHRERAARACADQGDFVRSCIECSVTSGRTWLSTTTEQQRAILALAVGPNPSHEAEARFRCATTQILSLHNILAATRAEVAQATQRLTTVEGRSPTVVSPGLPTDTALVMVQLVDGLMYEQLTRERDRAAAEVHLCERSPALRADQALPLVPAEMMFWPADLIRRNGFRLRTQPASGGVCTQEQQRLAMAQEQLERIERDPARTTANDLLTLSGYLRRIAQGCGDPTSQACLMAQANFRAYASAPAAGGVVPSATQPSLPSPVTDLRAGNP